MANEPEISLPTAWKEGNIRVHSLDAHHYLKGAGVTLLPPYTNAGVPTSGTSGTLAGVAEPGALLVDSTNKTLYQNTNTLASPTWTQFAVRSAAGDFTGTFNGTLGAATPAAAIVTTLAAAKSVSTTTSATVRAAYSKLTADYAGAVTTNGDNLCALRGEIALGNAATVLGSGYYYGAQGKVTAVSGATVGAGAHAFGLVGQLDLSIGHVTGDPQISAVWGDMGATGPSDGWGTASSILSGQNTTAFAVNSLLYLYGKATYAVDFNSNGSGIIAAAGASNAGSDGGKAADRVLAGIFDGVPGFIPIFNSNA
jgi:hypothetical protein